ncbi:MAG: hypothetical protein J5966_05570 [Lachnospiraceae bacterium]|nr:hypothetical protein [Lachnospiraceae bacterium]
MENENIEYIVDGYKYQTAEDAKLAKDEIRKVNYIKSKLNYEEPESVLVIYEKMLSGDVLSTPVGYGFLRETRSYLLDRGIDNERITSLPPFSAYSHGAERVRKDPMPRIVPAKPKIEYHKRFIAAVVLNIVLLLVIAAMFIITIKSSNPNVLNYEFAVQDRYATWEQELTEREKRIREKEKELGIEAETSKEPEDE